VVADDALPVDAVKSASTNFQVSALNVDVCESAGLCELNRNLEGKFDDRLEEEEQKSGKSEKLVSVSVVEEEISIYDDGRMALQKCSGLELVAEVSLAGCGDSAVYSQEERSHSEPLNPLTPTVTDDNVVLDTELSRTSSVSSALSLELCTHSAEMR